MQGGTADTGVTLHAVWRASAPSCPLHFQRAEAADQTLPGHQTPAVVSILYTTGQQMCSCEAKQPLAGAPGSVCPTSLPGMALRWILTPPLGCMILPQIPASTESPIEHMAEFCRKRRRTETQSSGEAAGTWCQGRRTHDRTGRQGSSSPLSRFTDPKPCLDQSLHSTQHSCTCLSLGSRTISCIVPQPGLTLW